MQSLGVSLAKRVNGKLARKGAVLRERYHVHILKTPSEVKRALNYVLGNEYKHASQLGWILRDEHSSAVTVSIPMWKALLGRDWDRILDPRQNRPQPELEKSIRALLTEPRTWLLREGWLRAS
jgi:hypothetical protein